MLLVIGKYSFRDTHDIEIIHTYKPSPPPTVRDYVNPKVGDKLYDTDNRYIQEWLTGNYL